MEEERESGWIGSEKEPLLPVLEPARRSGQPTFDGDDALLPHHGTFSGPSTGLWKHDLTLCSSVPYRHVYPGGWLDDKSRRP